MIAFDKPRALALFCQVQSFAFNPVISDEAIKSDIKKFKAQYYLTNETESSNDIKNHPLKDSASYELVFKNNLFKLFKIKTNSIVTNFILNLT